MDEMLGKVDSENQSLGLFDRSGIIAESLMYVCSVDRLLYTEAVGDFTEDDIPEEGIMVDQVPVFEGEHELSEREYDVVELGTDDIPHKDGASTDLSLHCGIEWKIDGHVLDGGIGLSGIIESIADEYVRVCSRDEGILVLRLAWKVLLHLSDHSGELAHPLGQIHVLQDNVGAV